VVEPVTRVEGHGRVTIEVTTEKIKDVKVSVVEPPRFFEKLLEGKPAEEAPRISERICGVCPVAHHLASVKAVESAWDVKPPEAAVRLRRLLLLGQYINSHTLHAAVLALPDFLGLKNRNVFSLAKEKPELADLALKIRRFGVDLTEKIGGREIHPVTAVPGGMSKPLDGEAKDNFLKRSDEIVKGSMTMADSFLSIYESRSALDLQREMSSPETYYMSLHDNDLHEVYEGNVKVIDPKGKTQFNFPPKSYLDYIAERSLPTSYVKYPYLRKLGYPEGLYRVGPLARLNATKITTPKAGAYLGKFAKKFGNPAHHPLAYNIARAIELVQAVELVQKMLRDERITGDDIRIEVKPKLGEGVGVVEAPRGTLIHHYATSGDGLIRTANLIVATGQNVPTIETGVRDFSKRMLPDILKEKDEVAWKIETLIRAYDPCISCATHIVEIQVDDHGQGRRTVR